MEWKQILTLCIEYFIRFAKNCLSRLDGPVSENSNVSRAWYTFAGGIALLHFVRTKTLQDRTHTFSLIVSDGNGIAAVISLEA